MIRRGGGHRCSLVFDLVGNKVSHIYSTLHHRCNYDSAISQLRVLASHKTNFEPVALGAWELDILPLGRCHFFMTLACLAIPSKKKCL